jgi:hypothetical protein
MINVGMISTQVFRVICGLVAPDMSTIMARWNAHDGFKHSLKIRPVGDAHPLSDDFEFKGFGGWILHDLSGFADPEVVHVLTKSYILPLPQHGRDLTGSYVQPLGHFFYR